LERELEAIERCDVGSEGGPKMGEELRIRRRAQDQRWRRAREQRGSERRAGACEAVADPIASAQSHRRRSTPGLRDCGALGDRDEEREDRRSADDAPPDDGREQDGDRAPASVATTAVRAEQAMAADDAIAGAFRVADEAAVPDQPADPAAMITGPELGAADRCPERDLVRDEPPGDDTGRSDAASKFLPTGSRTRPKSRSAAGVGLRRELRCESGAIYAARSVFNNSRRPAPNRGGP
jgi:hypothetical protein